MARAAPITTILPVALALAGCSGGEKRGDDHEAVPTESGPVASLPASAMAPPSRTPHVVPAHIQGRWGLVPADCTSTRGDAKGLLVIGPETLQFYESVGRLGVVEDRTDSRIRAHFGFTGEGQSWEHDVVLSLEDGGRKLTRREYGVDAPPDTVTYTRCD